MMGQALILHSKNEIVTLSQWWDVESRAAAGDGSGDGIAQEAAALWLL